LFPAWEHDIDRYESYRPKQARGLLEQASGDVALERWYKLMRAAHLISMDEVQRAAPKSKVLNRERVRFEVAGGNCRLVVAFDFRRQVAFIKFIGTHAEYNRIDALTVS
jgi:mRNA interferase HigB